MAENMFLFVPNIVDYLRVVFAFASFYYMQTDPGMTSVLYITSGLLDNVDGPLARTLNQESKLGAMLDQTIDRMTTMCMCAALCHFYPKNMLFFQFYMALDIVSHWFYVHSSLLTGSTSHKAIDLGANLILRHYYNNEIILTVMCIANDLFLCMLYLCFFSDGPFIHGMGLWKIILYLSAPISLAKTGISIIQLGVAMVNIANIDVADREKIKQNSPGCHRWFVFLSTCVVMINGFGLLGSIGRLLVIVMDTFNTSRTEAALVQSMASGVMGTVGIVTGSFVHKYHPRICGMVGASLTSLGFSLCFFATSIVYMYVGIGRYVW